MFPSFVYNMNKMSEGIGVSLIFIQNPASNHFTRCQKIVSDPFATCNSSLNINANFSSETTKRRIYFGDNARESVAGFASSSAALSGAFEQVTI